NRNAWKLGAMTILASLVVGTPVVAGAAKIGIVLVGDSTVTDNAGYDGTHLNAQGHVLFARLVVEELRQAVPDLAPVLREQPLNENPVATGTKYDAVVSFDGSGTHTNLQAAVDAAPDNGTDWFTILVKPGVYEGQVIVPKTKHFIRVIGEEVENTKL